MQGLFLRPAPRPSFPPPPLLGLSALGPGLTARRGLSSALRHLSYRVRVHGGGDAGGSDTEGSPALISGGDAEPSGNVSTRALPPSTNRRGRGRSRPWLRPSLVVLFLVIVAWAVIAGVQAVSAVRQARTALGYLDVARSQLSANLLSGDAPPAALDAASSGFSAAHSRIESPLFAPVSVLPVLGRQLSSARALTGSAAELASAADEAALQASAALRLPRSTPAERLVVLSRLSAAASRASAAVSSVNYGPSKALLGPLASARAKLVSDVAKVGPALRRSSSALRAAVLLLSGDHKILFLGAANAEMRDGSGSFLVAGEATTSHGQFQLGKLLPASAISSVSAPVPVAKQLSSTWYLFDQGKYLDSLGMSPEFSENGPVAAELWKKSTGEQVGTVMALDGVALQDLLSATGPVQAAGTTFDSSNVLTYLDSGQYRGQPPGGGPGDSAGQVVLLQLIQGVTAKLDAGSFDPSTLGSALANAADGRHILVWSRQSALESDWSKAGVAGKTGVDGMMVGLANLGSNKLDPYMSVSVSFSTSPEGSSTRVVMDVKVHDGAPPGPPSLIEGPLPGSLAKAGEYLGVLSVHLPGWVKTATIHGAGPRVAGGPDGSGVVLSTEVHVDAGRTGEWVLDAIFPGHHGEISVLPSARVPPESWSAGGTTFTDASSHTISW